MTDDPAVLLTPEEAARRLRIGRTRLYALIAAGDLASITIGRSPRITPQALDDYVQRLAGNPAPAAAVPAPGKTARTAGRRAGLIEVLHLPFVQHDTGDDPWHPTATT